MGLGRSAQYLTKHLTSEFVLSFAPFHLLLSGSGRPRGGEGLIVRPNCRRVPPSLKRPDKSVLFCYYPEYTLSWVAPKLASWTVRSLVVCSAPPEMAAHLWEETQWTRHPQGTQPPVTPVRGELRLDLQIQRR